MNSSHRYVACLLLCLLCARLVSSCQARKIGEKPGDEMNSAMSEQQKALIAEHKKQAEQ